MQTGASPQVPLPFCHTSSTAPYGTHGDPSRRPRARERTRVCPRHGLRVQVRRCRTAGTTRGSGLRLLPSSQTTWRAPFEERRVARHGLKLRTNPGVSKHHLPRNNARYALQTARHRRCRWPIILDETRVCRLVVLWLSSSFCAF